MQRLEAPLRRRKTQRNCRESSDSNADSFQAQLGWCASSEGQGTPSPLMYTITLDGKRHPIMELRDVRRLMEGATTAEQRRTAKLGKHFVKQERPPTRDIPAVQHAVAELQECVAPFLEAQRVHTTLEAQPLARFITKYGTAATYTVTYPDKNNIHLKVCVYACASSHHPIIPSSHPAGAL